MSDLLSITSRIAREAGGLLLEYLARRVKVEYKGEMDLVTVADRASEALILERIGKEFPGHAVVAEESGVHEMDSEYRWYIDPLDGTTNFAHGYPVFCVSMAVEKNGELEAGVVYDPTRAELFAAEKGQGTTLNGEPIRVSSIAHLKEALVVTGFPSRKRHKNPNIHFYHQFNMMTHGVRRPGSAALDLAYVAAGRMDAFWEFNLHAWDVAAGKLLVEEAGGVVTQYGGQAHRVDSGSILAANPALHPQMVEMFGEIFAGRYQTELPELKPPA